MDLDIYLRFALALAFVLGLIGFIGWLARRYGLGGRVGATGGKQRRIGVVEVQPVDAKRRLVLVRRDDTEHLLLIGPGRDLLVESRIAPRPTGPAFAELVEDRQPEAVQ